MNQAIQLLQNALKIYSPSKKEAKLAKYLLRRMKGELGFKNTMIDAGGNAIGEMGDGDIHVLLCGHMDTVPGELPTGFDGKRVFGRGAVDAKSALCAMIVAASQLTSKKLKITMACATREEGDSLGIETLIDAGGDYDYAIFGEPAGASRVTVGYRGRVEFHIGTHTKGGHAASPWANPSAIDEAMSVFERIKQYERKNTQEENHYRSLSVALTLIEGGTYSNVIPDNCAMTLDVRVPVGMRCGRVQEEIRKIISAYQKERRVAKFEVAFGKPTEPYESDLNSTLIRSFQRSIIKNLGEKPVLTHKTGTGDMNTLAESMKIPCATYGPGDSKLAHTDEEYVMVKDYLNSIRVLTGAFDELEHLA